MKVYAISQASTGLVKIGMSRDPMRRMRALRTNSAHPLRLEYAVEVDDARIVERVAHVMLADWRMVGEWFNVSVEQARTAINLAAEQVQGGTISVWKAPSAPQRPHLALPRQRAPRAKRIREYPLTLTMRVTPEFKEMLDELAQCEDGYPLPTHSDLIRQAVDEKLALLLAAAKA